MGPGTGSSNRGALIRVFSRPVSGSSLLLGILLLHFVNSMSDDEKFSLFILIEPERDRRRPALPFS